LPETIEMKISALFVGVALVLMIITTVLGSGAIMQFGMDSLGLGWTASFVAPRLLMLLLTALLVSVFWNAAQVGSRMKVVLSILLFSACVGGYLAVNLPYKVDWSRTGTDMGGKLDGNPIELMLNESQPDFNGLVMLALPNCPYCFEALPKVRAIKQRQPDIDIAVFVFARDSGRMEFFKEHIGSVDFPVYLITDRGFSKEICGGMFPAFLYYKNGKVVHNWAYNEFGYPALDWVEDRLN